MLNVGQIDSLRTAVAKCNEVSPGGNEERSEFHHIKSARETHFCCAKGWRTVWIYESMTRIFCGFKSDQRSNENKSDCVERSDRFIAWAANGCFSVEVNIIDNGIKWLTRCILLY